MKLEGFFLRGLIRFYIFSHRLSTCESGNSYDSGYSGRDSSASNMTCNPDMQASIPQIMQLLDQVHSGQQQLLQLWQIKKAKLDQCLQLRLFEQDCEKVKFNYAMAMHFGKKRSRLVVKSRKNYFLHPSVFCCGSKHEIKLEQDTKRGL